MARYSFVSKGGLLGRLTSKMIWIHDAAYIANIINVKLSLKECYIGEHAQ